MTKFVRSLVLAVAVVCSVGAAAQMRAPAPEAAPPAEVSRFLMGTRLGYITCSNQYRAYLEKWELYALVNEGQTAPKASPPSDDAPSACVHETLLKGRSLYNDASRQAESPATRAALRDYHTAWEKSLQSIRQATPEKVRDYRERQKRAEGELDALQTRLERAK